MTRFSVLLALFVLVANATGCAAMRPERDAVKRWEEVPEAAYDPAARLAAMDADGVECEVMYSEFDFTSKVYHVGEHWRECATAYNNTLHEFASIDPKRRTKIPAQNRT